MAQKRQPEVEAKLASGGSSADDKRQKITSFKQAVLEAMKRNSLQKLLSAMEPLLRKVVKEEVELALSNHLANMSQECGKQIYPSTSRSLQLQFKNKLSLPIFTGTKIEGEDCSAITLALVDDLTAQVIMSGPESSMKVEIVVLEGDFEVDEPESWTFEEFKNNIVKEREGRRSLLTGDVSLDLKEGIGVVAELSFTDNSSWTRSRKFRLGARVADGYFNGIRVREAKSESFMVKDHRGELYKKHYPPSLGDEVWRLEKIGKDGAFHKRLSFEQINTVKDFLTLLSTDASRLRNILGSGMSAKMWEVTVEHARTCVLSEQMYVHCPDGQRKSGVVFNIVGEVKGLLSEQQFVPFSDLSENEKLDAQTLVKLAFESQRSDVYNSIAAPAPAPAPTPSASPIDPCFLPSLSTNIYSSFPTPIKVDDNFAYSYSNISMPDIASLTSGFDATYPVEDQGGCEPREVERLLFDSFLNDDNLSYLDMEIPSHSLVVKDSPADLGTAVTGFLAMSARAAARMRANNGWTMLVSVLRWRFSIRRIIKKKIPVPDHDGVG